MADTDADHILQRSILSLQKGTTKVGQYSIIKPLLCFTVTTTGYKKLIGQVIGSVHLTNRLRLPAKSATRYYKFNSSLSIKKGGTIGDDEKKTNPKQNEFNILVIYRSITGNTDGWWTEKDGERAHSTEINIRILFSSKEEIRREIKHPFFLPQEIMKANVNFFFH